MYGDALWAIQSVLRPQRVPAAKLLSQGGCSVCVGVTDLVITRRRILLEFGEQGLGMPVSPHNKKLSHTRLECPTDIYIVKNLFIITWARNLTLFYIQNIEDLVWDCCLFFFSHGGIIRYLFLFQHTAILFNFPGLPVQNNFWPPSFRSKYVLKIEANVGLCPIVWWSCLCIDIVKFTVQVSSVQLLSRVQLCNPMDCGTPGFPIHHQLQELSFTGQWDSMVIF